MFLRLQLHWGIQQSTQAAHAPASPLGPSNATISVPQNFYLGGSAYVAPRLPYVRLRRSTHLGARRQKHCDTMDLESQ